MKYIVTAKQMKEYDNNTITKIGIPALVLMERAALAVEQAIVETVEDIHTALIVCGTGNNGADGLALARLLCEKGIQVTVGIVGSEERSTEQWKVQKNILNHYSVKILCQSEVVDTLENYASAQVHFDVVADALFGVGLSRAVEGMFAQIVKCLNKIRGKKVAIDIPSGIHTDFGKIMGKAFRADLTVTFGFAKRGMYLYPGREYCGKVIVADIGISSRAFWGTVPELFIYDEEPNCLLPKRQKNGNKGTFGKILIVAGFEKMAGAAVLCAKAALQCGAGMVKVFAGEENRVIIQTALPEVLWGTEESLAEDLQWADVVVIGPGMGKSSIVAGYLSYILETCNIPLILDADALNLISEDEKLRNLVKACDAEIVMTPHMGELSRLLKQTVSDLKENIFEVAQDAAKKYNAIMVCKDAVTVVGSPCGRLYLNVTGNDGMATAGSGDVLSGMLGGIFAQYKDGFYAATVAVYLHGAAGDNARSLYTEYGVTAGRIIDSIVGEE